MYTYASISVRTGNELDDLGTDHQKKEVFTSRRDKSRTFSFFQQMGPQLARNG